MRLNFRIKAESFTFFAMLSKTQTLEGVTSLCRDGRQIVMWDLEDCSLIEATKILSKVQSKYCLSHIYIASDAEGSYRAWCFSKVTLKIFLKILVDSLSILDYNFLYYTVKRKKATLRVSSKRGRPVQTIIGVLRSYPCPIPSTMEKVVYDTGLMKRGRSLLLGGD